MKNTSLSLAAFTAAALFCSPVRADAPSTPPKEIVVATFPAYDWTRQIVGVHTNTLNVSLMEKNGVDLHSYKPSARDVVRILKADLFVYVGGESDGWAESLAEKKRAAHQRVVDFMHTLRDATRPEETVEGMQAEDEHEHEHAHEHEHGHDHEHEHEVEKDEHVWLSLRFAARLVDALAAEIAAIDPAHAADYRANAAAYRAKILALDARYAEMARTAKRKTMLFADRFPFRYLAEDYGLKYYAAFAGCSAESEASFKTVVFLASKVDALKLPCVLTLERSGGKIAAAVLGAAHTKPVRILSVDSLQSGEPRDYLQAMTANLAVFAQALN